MRNILLVTFILSFCIAQGQPTITSASFPMIGTITYNSMFDATNISEGLPGTNQVWNFNVTPGWNLGSRSFVTPSSTPYFSSFPGANIAIKNIQGTATIYQYFNHSSNFTEFIGDVFVPSNFTHEFIYSDGWIQRVYPSTYNSSFSDSFSASLSTISQGGCVVKTRVGTTTATADAFGILTTPLGTFNNTMRFKIDYSYHDTTLFIGCPNPPEYLHVKTTNFSWIDQMENYQLFEINYDTIIANTNPAPIYSKYGIFQTGISLDINEISLKNVVSFPNPAIDFVKIDASEMKSGEALLQIFDVTGKLVKNQTVVLGNTSDKYLVLETEEFKSGLYFLNLIQDKYKLSSKFIRQ